MLMVLCVLATSNVSSILGAAVNQAMDARKTSIVLMTAFVWLGRVPIGVPITEIVRAHGFATKAAYVPRAMFVWRPQIVTRVERV